MLSIVTWNSAASIEACLASLLAQTYTDFTVWVTDNASADDTCARVAAVAARDARIQLYRLSANTGFCGGHNYALDRTRTEFVLLVNPDVELAPDYLARALQAMRRDARIGVVCGLLLQSHDADPRIDSAGMQALPDGRYCLRLYTRPLSTVDLQPGYVDGADGALPLLRRRYIDDLRVEGQFFDERFFAHKEDWDVAWRGQLYGWRTWFEPGCRALHPRVFRPGNLALRQRLAGAIKADAVKNQLLLLLKNAPAGRAWRTWLRALPRQLAIFTYLLLREPSSLRAYRYVWQHRRAVLASRWLVQARARRGWQPALGAPAPEPLLSICVPTYRRPELLARALRSVGPLPAEVELLVSDNSPRDDWRNPLVARYALRRQPAAQVRYYHNAPGGNSTTNWQACLRRARGRYVLMLHDDDYLLPGGLQRILQTLRHDPKPQAAYLFGVDIVDVGGRVLRRQPVPRAGYLPPAEALQAVLTNSSLVRIPALVAERRACLTLGLDPAQQGSDDTDLWMRLFARHGLQCVPARTAAYTIHPDAETTSFFNETGIGLLLRLFGKAERLGLLPFEQLEQAQSKFLHQFILAGVYRALRQRDLPAARQVLRLFELPELQHLAVPLRWLPARLGLTLWLLGSEWLPAPPHQLPAS
ncbi:glycosyltransferase family 2 protein [Hymenobacter gummosus]|uniref:glycosyltransferase family 2 protein n=1 Tax=Hymenobacter gummosus TaxID=1776032 RepID=UPI001404ADF8|nr:glycosyltransferase [Hymenobacter gummosus]